MMVYVRLTWECKRMDILWQRLIKSLLIAVTVVVALVILYFVALDYLYVVLGGVLVGGLYALAALGLALVFGVMKILNLAHGSMMVLGAYLSFWFFTLYGIDPFISVVLVIPILFLLGFAIEYFLMDKVATLTAHQPVLVAFGLMVVLESLFMLLWTADPRGLVLPYSGARLTVGGLHISLTRFVACVLSVVGLVCLAIIMNRTLIGRAIQAVSQDFKAACFVGINARRMYQLAFGIGAAFAGFAGSLISVIYAFEPTSGLAFVIKALAVIVLAGSGRISGLIIAGVVLGIIESVGAMIIGGGFKDAISFAVFLLVLLLKPEGLFGRRG
ncbi:MAG: branched-chain amino acid ABC transporter permease [Nitrososphaerales archaeon]